MIVPTIEGRPGNVERLAESLIASTGLADLTVVADAEQVVDNLPVNARVVYFDGTFAEKVNHVWPLTTGDWIMLAGDDVVFHAGWWDHAQFTADTTGADVIGTNDLANSRVMAGEHATHPILRREYVETEGASWDGELCHEGYRHWFVDDEIVTKAKLAGRFAPSLGSIVEHLHPMVGKSDIDAVYEKGAASKDADAKLFRTRLHKYASASVPVG